MVGRFYRSMLQRLYPVLDHHYSPPLVILVVEDETLIRDLVVTHLRDAECVVLEANTGERAVQFLDQVESLDVVFTDIRLNGSMNGWDVGEAFRAARDDFPVIYTSGQLVEPRRPVPGSVFFEKPYQPPDVLDACKRI